MFSEIITLELIQKLRDQNIITEFTFNPENRSITLNLNTKYNKILTLISPISFDQFDELQNEDIEKLRSELHRNKVESNDILNILEVLELDINKNRMLESIREYYRQNLKEPKQTTEEEEENNNYNKKEIIKEEEQKYDSVFLTLRKHFGSARPRGTITGISKLSVMISKVSFYCDNCQFMTELDFALPESNDKDIDKKCGKCHKFTRNDLNPEYKNAVIIELQDTDTFNDMDRLTVFLFDEDTERIRIGETVIITGDMEIVNNGKRLYTCLNGKSIHYLNRENFTLSEYDIKEIDEFVNTTTTNKSQLIDKLVSIFDTSIVEYDHVKKGLLMAAVNTSDDITRNERINILLIGDPGLAKSKLAKRVTQLVPNSRHESGQSSSGKSLTAIIEKTYENTFLRPGPIPLAKGAICSINELGRQSMEDQGHLLDVMEEGEFTKNAFGKNVRIRSPTTIIATANPVNNSRWRDNDKVDLSEFPVLEPIRDRFDLKFVFKDRNEWKEIDEFADKLSEIEDKKDRGILPDYTIFLIKYLQYAKQFNPILTEEARKMLTDFYKEIRKKNFGSPRVLITLPKLVKAIARLKLKEIADEEDAKEAMQFYNVMLLDFQKSVVISQSPREVAYQECLSVLKEITNFGGFTFEELIEKICQRNIQLAQYFGYRKVSLQIKHNKKSRNVYDMLLNDPKIKKIGEKPTVLQWLSDPNDLSDHDNKDKKEKNNETQKNNNVSTSKPGSLESLESPEDIISTEEEEDIDKAFKLSENGPIHYESEYKSS